MVCGQKAVHLGSLARMLHGINPMDIFTPDFDPCSSYNYYNCDLLEPGFNIPGDFAVTPVVVLCVLLLSNFSIQTIKLTLKYNTAQLWPIHMNVICYKLQLLLSCLQGTIFNMQFNAKSKSISISSSI